MSQIVLINYCGKHSETITVLPATILTIIQYFFVEMFRVTLKYIVRRNSMAYHETMGRTV